MSPADTGRVRRTLDAAAAALEELLASMDIDDARRFIPVDSELVTLQGLAEALRCVEVGDVQPCGPIDAEDWGTR